MPFKSQAQRAWMYANKPSMAKRWQADTPKGIKLPMKKNKFENSSKDKAMDKKMGYKEGSKKDNALDKKYQGKGTRARLNTAASKNFFGSRVSK